jgi:hypothetical protein
MKYLCILALLALAGCASADVLWDNGMNYTGLGSAQDDPSISFTTEMADDFMLAGNLTIQDVHWRGGYWNTNYATGAFNWRIRIYNDAGDVPGNTLFDHVYLNAEVNRVFIEDTGSTIYYDYSVGMADLPLAAGKYWLSCQGVGAFPPQSGWAMHTSPILLHQAYFRSVYFGYPDWTNSQTVFGTAYDNCFQITGVPEPGVVSLAGMLLGLGGIVWFRRK